MNSPIISIIMPVYNTEEFLPETIRNLQAQTFADFEVVCVDDGSTDRSVEILTETAESDPRFRILQQTNAGAGAARNYGFAASKGDYAIFLDSDDMFSPQLLEKLHEVIVAENADIAACNFSKLWPDGRVTQHEGVHVRWIPEGLTVFNYRDTPDYIMRVINPTPWNKLYRSAFIREKGLKYEEITSTNDITFAAVSVAAAERVTFTKESLVCYRVGHAGTISSTKSKRLNNVAIAINSAVRQAKQLPYADEINNSIISFVVDNFIVSLSGHIKDFSDPIAAAYYQLVHETFNQEELAHIDERTIHNPKQFREFCTVKKHDYAVMKQLVSRKLIVSLTTYPKRIGLIGPVLDSIYNQTRKADEVVLWLAQEQFPGKEADLPENLLQLVAEKKLTIRWCDDLKPHKKYFYALQEYADDLVVTVDDDLTYPLDMLDALYRSYLLHPDAVSTLRAHLMMLDENHRIMPYGNWIQETDFCIYEPSMQLMATGGAGVLYPPHLLKKEFFNAEVIRQRCLWADDLWLKIMQIMSDVPVVVARPHEQLHYLPDSQEEALHRLNVGRNHNDVQLESVSQWLDETYEPGILVKKLTGFEGGRKILGMEAVGRHLDGERKILRRNWSQADSKIKNCEQRTKVAESTLRWVTNKRKEAEDKLKETGQNLRRTEQQLSRTEQKLTQTEQKLCQTQQKLTQTEQKLRQTEQKLQQKLARTEQKLQRAQQRARELEPLASFGGQYNDLGRFVRELKQSNGFSLGWGLKYALYLAGWLPAKFLIATSYLLRNGVSAAGKRLIQKFKKH